MIKVDLKAYAEAMKIISAGRRDLALLGPLTKPYRHFRMPGEDVDSA